MGSVPKKRRIEPDRDHQTKAIADKAPIPLQSYLRSDVGVVRIDLNVQLAKKHAVSQAQKEGCLGNFRSFDSPFGNYLVPVIPTKADLLRTSDMSAIHHDSSSDLRVVGSKLKDTLGITNTSLRTRKMVIELCDVIAERGA